MAKAIFLHFCKENSGKPAPILYLKKRSGRYIKTPLKAARCKNRCSLDFFVQAAPVFNMLSNCKPTLFWRAGFSLILGHQAAHGGGVGHGVFHRQAFNQQCLLV